MNLPIPKVKVVPEQTSLLSCYNLLTMTVRPTGRDRSRILRLAYWNANSIHNKKLEMVQFLSDHDIDICLINETHLLPGQDFRKANYGSHKNDRPTQAAEL
jgi:Exonuclease III